MLRPLPDYGYNSVYRKFSAIYLQNTTSCHNNCIFCAYIKDYRNPRSTHPIDRNRVLSIGDLTHVLKSIPDFRGTVAMGITGEDIILADLPDRIALIKKYWPHCHCNMTSTFNIYHGDDYVAALFNNGLDNLYISCYGYTADDYALMHGSKRFDGLCKNIAAVGRLGKSTGKRVGFSYFNNVEKSFDIKDAGVKMSAFKEFACENGVTDFSGKDYFAWKMPRPLGGDWSLPSPCSVVWGQRGGILNIHANLDIVPCCMFSGKEVVFGNLGRDSLENIFKSREYRDFQEKWWAMRSGEIPVCNSCECYVDNSAPVEIYRLADWQAKKLAGQDVLFWGAGEAYRSFGSLFNASHARAMLLDTVVDAPAEVDGIPVRHPDDVLKADCALPLVIFAAPRASAKIVRVLKEKYPQYRPAELVICPANSALNS